MSLSGNGGLDQKGASPAGPTGATAREELLWLAGQEKRVGARLVRGPISRSPGFKAQRLRIDGVRRSFYLRWATRVVPGHAH